MCWLPFANSLVHDPLGRNPPEDRLAAAAWRREFAAQAGLPPLRRWSPATRARLEELRTALHGWSSSLATRGELSPAEIAALNASWGGIVVRTSVQRGPSGWRRELRPLAGGVTAWVFAIGNAFVEFLLTAEPQRIRLCQNPACRWIFYDATRSRTRRWCADSCGDLIKVRAFRARHDATRRRRRAKPRPGPSRT